MNLFLSHSLDGKILYAENETLFIFLSPREYNAVLYKYKLNEMRGPLSPKLEIIWLINRKLNLFYL